MTEVEKNCGYTFKDGELLRKALTLCSYDNNFNNQSLECLGDALLGFIVADKYYAEGATEEQITNEKKLLLSDEALAPVSERLKIAQSLICGKGDDNNKKAVPSAYEAMVAAIYLDGGLEEAKKFALSTLTPLSHPDYISEVQMILQSHGESAPVYVCRESGTPRNPRFTVTATVREREYVGEGGTKAEAKRFAAEAVYGAIKED